VLSEIPEAFASWVREWQALASVHTTVIDEESTETPCAPSPADQFLFYQTALGAYPLAHGPDESFTNRLSEYMVKAAREAKRHTSWLAPDDAYEGALRNFVSGMLSDEAFLESLDAKACAIATYGASNGLAQTLLKVASPGVPDVYQGSETWDYRLVDPDNRAPVDYARLSAELASLGEHTVRELVASFRDGRVKLHVLSRALRLRRDMASVFALGEYVPLDCGEHVVAFARPHPTGTVVCAVTRRPYAVTGGRAPWACGDVWGDRKIPLPEGVWRDALGDGREIVATADGARAAELFRDLPVALVVAAQ
jgi:(1->4)-alpha-D-glucan 1-alpha-D-glucosylmutase